MKKVTILIIFIAVSFQILSQTRITGTIEGLSAKADILYLILPENKTLKAIDTSEVYKDSFEFQISDLEPKIYAVVSWKDFKTEPKGFIFWVDSNNITISGRISDIMLNKNLKQNEAYLSNLCSNLEIKGSVNQELLNSFIDNNKEDLFQYFAIKNKVFIKKEKSPKKIIREKMLYRTESFITNHNDKPCSAFIVFWLGGIQHLFDKKETKRLLSLLTEECKQTYYARLAYDLLHKYN